jgi:hypothetical protein
MKLQAFLVVSSVLAVALAFSGEHITPYSNFDNILTKNGRLFPQVNDGNTTEQRETRPLSDIVGVWQKPSSPLLFGPDFGAATSPPNTVRIFSLLMSASLKAILTLHICSGLCKSHQLLSPI